jgi:hypothetical protein
MIDFQAIADRFQIETLRGEIIDAVMMGDYDRLASLFTHDGGVRIPDINAEAVSREEIRAGIERPQGLLEYFVQTALIDALDEDDEVAAEEAVAFVLTLDDQELAFWTVVAAIPVPRGKLQCEAVEELDAG